MTAATQSLRSYLQAPNPTLHGHSCPRKATRSSSNSYEYPDAVFPWDEFNSHTLDNFSQGDLGKALNLTFDLAELPNLNEAEDCVFSDEDSLEHILKEWNYKIVQEALRETQHHFQKPEGAPIIWARGGRTQPVDPQNTRLKPDWAGIWRPTLPEEQKGKNLLPGDSKLSKNWRSELIVDGQMDPARSRKWAAPIGQIFTYCLRNNTRYGYLFTDAELVAIRVRFYRDSAPPVAGTEDPIVEEGINVPRRNTSEGVLEYKSIPWGSTSDLTVNMTLWWLFIMATGNTGIEWTYCALKDEEWGLILTEPVREETVVRPACVPRSIPFYKLTIAAALLGPGESFNQTRETTRPAAAKRQKA